MLDLFIATLIITITGFFIKSYFNGPYCTLNRNLEGKTIFITGANSGIGKATAIQLALKGANIIMACRDFYKGKSIQEEIFIYVKILFTSIRLKKKHN